MHIKRNGVTFDRALLLRLDAHIVRSWCHPIRYSTVNFEQWIFSNRRNVVFSRGSGDGIKFSFIKKLAAFVFVSKEAFRSRSLVLCAFVAIDYFENDKYDGLIIAVAFWRIRISLSFAMQIHS